VKFVGVASNVPVQFTAHDPPWTVLLQSVLPEPLNASGSVWHDSSQVRTSHDPVVHVAELEGVKPALQLKLHVAPERVSSQEEEVPFR